MGVRCRAAVQGQGREVVAPVCGIVRQGQHEGVVGVGKDKPTCGSTPTSGHVDASSRSGLHPSPSRQASTLAHPMPLPSGGDALVFFQGSRHRPNAIQFPMKSRATKVVPRLVKARLVAPLWGSTHMSDAQPRVHMQRHVWGAPRDRVLLKSDVHLPCRGSPHGGVHVGRCKHG